MRRLLIPTTLLLLGGYSMYTTVRMRQLENRLHEEQLRRPENSRVVYAFDDSFRQYFGEKGVAAVEQALQIMRSRKMEPGLKIDEAPPDFLTDPLRLDDR